MTLPEAVTKVIRATQPLGLGVSPDFLEALKLLIKAGQGIIKWRGTGDDDTLMCLPGETSPTEAP